MGYTSENTVLPNEAGRIVGAASIQLSCLPTALAGVVAFSSAALTFIIAIDQLSWVRRVVWQGGKKKEKVKGRKAKGRKGHVGVMLR